MLTPCEIIIKKFLPAVRAGVTKKLYKEYSFSQEEIASYLGLTQANVSYYLASKYGSQIKELEKNREVRRAVEEIASSIAAKKASAMQVLELICSNCREYRKSSRAIICELHKQSFPIKEECIICR